VPARELRVLGAAFSRANPRATRGPRCRSRSLSTVIAVPEKGDVLAISIPRTEAHVIRHFQERMPYGLFVPDVAVE
jgi:hypothetical protein